MANSLSTSVAQKLNITCFRGEKFELTINVKNADGTDYDFGGTENTHDVDFIITDSNGHYPNITNEETFGMLSEGTVGGGTLSDNAPVSAPSVPNASNNAGLVGSYCIQNISNNNGTNTVDGKISIDAGTNGMRLWPGVYKYHILTHAAGTEAQIIWLYGKLTVKAINNDINQTLW